MFESLSSKVITGIIALGSMFYSSISGVNPEFDSCDIFIQGNQLILSASLDNCFSEDLDKIFQSGQEIRIHFLIQVFRDRQDQPKNTFRVYHSIRHSLLDRYYEVYSSETEEIYQFETLTQAKERLRFITNYSVLTQEEVPDDGQHFIKVSAFMNKIHLPDINEEINLMYYWNSLRPEIDSRKFTAAIFRQ